MKTTASSISSPGTTWTASSSSSYDKPQHRPITSQHGHAGGRALVLGGGGSTGNAWLIGVVAGLMDGGLDVTAADLLVGTSAGATAAAQLSGSNPTELFADILRTAPASLTAPAGSLAGQAPSRSVSEHLQRLTATIAAASDAADMRRRMGATALGQATTADDALQSRWRTTVAARLPNQDWLDRRMLVTAVDARTGEPIVFDRHGGVALVDAVAASCAGGFAYRIDARHYIDGGYRRNENADLARGYERVLVLAPLSGRSLHPAHWRMDLAAQVADLRRDGSVVETIVPERDTTQLFGVNAMNITLRPSAAQVGHDHGRALAMQLSDFWC
ncbi:MAG: patatin-like phospholipase family protein [Actinomycetota bacterium]|nr:MAG: patatin-like phospholipase family protein [Actinomycetota bacterium]